MTTMPRTAATSFCQRGRRGKDGCFHETEGASGEEGSTWVAMSAPTELMKAKRANWAPAGEAQRQCRRPYARAQTAGDRTACACSRRVRVVASGAAGAVSLCGGIVPARMPHEPASRTRSAVSHKLRSYQRTRCAPCGGTVRAFFQLGTTSNGEDLC